MILEVGGASDDQLCQSDFLWLKTRACDILIMTLLKATMRRIESRIAKSSAVLVYYDDSSFSFSPAVVSMQWQKRRRLLFIWPLTGATQIWWRSF